MTRHTMVLAVSMLWPWTFQQPTTKPHVVGFVLSVTGHWLAETEALKLGQAVAAGSTIKFAPQGEEPLAPGDTYRIQIVLLNNEPKECDSSMACREGFVLPSSLTNQRTILERIDDVFSLIFRQPDRYVGMLSRGEDLNAVTLQDGVVRLRSGELMLAPLFKDVPSGLYRLRFKRFGSVSDQVERVLINADWDERVSSSVTLLATVRPGLYLVSAARSDQPNESAQDAWVLIADTAHFDLAHTEYGKAVAASRSWRTDNGRRDVDRFLHAYLADLAGRMG